MADRVDTQSFKSVRERDIDLLLLEEITVSPEFRRFLVENVGENPARIDEFVGGWHSVSDSALGESDLEVGTVESGGTRTLTMIENKIGASFQERQLPRYHERGEQAVNDDWDAYRVLVTAPHKYLDRVSVSAETDALLSYESIRDWFSDQESPRADFKADMLTDAIEQNRRGYTPEPDDQVTALHRRYWAIARDQFPTLELPEPTGVPSGNSWIRFRPSSLPEDVQLIHKTERGHIDLQFSGARENEEPFSRQYEPQLTDEMNIVPTGKSLSIRLNVSPLDATVAPTEQEDEILDGLSGALELLDWFNQSERSSVS